MRLFPHLLLPSVHPPASLLDDLVAEDEDLNAWEKLLEAAPVPKGKGKKEKRPAKLGAEEHRLRAEDALHDHAGQYMIDLNERGVEFVRDSHLSPLILSQLISEKRAKVERRRRNEMFREEGLADLVEEEEEGEGEDGALDFMTQMMGEIKAAQQIATSALARLPAPPAPLLPLMNRFGEKDLDDEDDEDEDEDDDEEIILPPPAAAARAAAAARRPAAKAPAAKKPRKK